ncbi:Eukaryotic translation initiation factor 5B [Diplonema papillatum]|nr:Eukaryotic translation initiation factor 5B [Diplonema papillatum]
MPPKKAAAKAGAKKGPSSAIAALKLKREKELEEERKRKEEEEAERQKQEDEEKQAAEAEKLRLERIKEHKTTAEKLPPGLSAAQKRQKEENRKKLEQMQASGMKIPDAMLKKLQGDDGAEPAADGDAEKAKKPKVKTETLAQKKKRLEKEKAEKEAAGTTAKAAEEQAADEQKEAEDWEEAADWEEEAEKKDEPAPAAAVHEDPNAEPAADATPEEDKAPVKEKEKEEPQKPKDLRSPICCVLGHVDTGKTKLLDCIRRTNVQHGEAGGITQQIGASFFPVKSLLEKTKSLNDHLKQKLAIEVPGLLVIDTPGHESFANLRGRGSALCDIAILVVDIMHGLEAQTKESIQLLKKRKCPFVVALNKIDRLFEWVPHKDMPFPLTLKKQKDYVKQEFRSRMDGVAAELSEQGLNSCLYTENKNFLKNVSLVPTSAHTGEGIPDLLMLMVQLTQRHMNAQLMYTDELKCTVLEVKKIEGHGVTIDVILVNGTLREGDTILICGLNGPIVTQVRALLTPHPMKEIRVKGEYIHHKAIKAAQGIKIAATGLEDAVPGTPMLVVKDGDDIEELQEEVMRELGTVIKRTQGDFGVAVQASTLGALEALLVFLQDSKIPVSTVGVGDLHKKTIMRVVGMKEKHPKYAVILCFDVAVTKEAQEFADKEEITIFTADIIYHLQDKFNKYLEDYTNTIQDKNKVSAVFPCELITLPGKAFNKKNPILLGMEVVQGQLRVGTPLFAWKKNENGKTVPFHVGKVEAVEKEHKPQKVSRKGQQVAVKIKTETVTFGRQIDETDHLWSEITRDSIDALKESFRGEMEKEDWAIILKLKKQLNIL